MAQRPSYTTAEERSLKELFSEMTGEIGLLVRKEVELAKLEMKEKASLAAKGGVAMAVAGVMGLFALLLLSFAAAWGLAEVLAPGVAFVIVGAFYLVLAAVMFSSGRKKLAQMKPPMPEQALTTIKQDVQVAKGSLQRGMSGSMAGRAAVGRR